MNFVLHLNMTKNPLVFLQPTLGAGLLSGFHNVKWFLKCGIEPYFR